MGQVITPPAEIEQERQEELERLQLEPGQDFSPGTMGCHEAFHTASVLMDAVSRSLVEHPAVVQDEEWYRLAHQAHENLFNLYQAIGAKHL